MALSLSASCWCRSPIHAGRGRYGNDARHHSILRQSLDRFASRSLVHGADQRIAHIGTRTRRLPVAGHLAGRPQHSARRGYSTERVHENYRTMMNIVIVIISESRMEETANLPRSNSKKTHLKPCSVVCHRRFGLLGCLVDPASEQVSCTRNLSAEVEIVENLVGCRGRRREYWQAELVFRGLDRP